VVRPTQKTSLSLENLTNELGFPLLLWLRLLRLSLRRPVRLLSRSARITTAPHLRGMPLEISTPIQFRGSTAYGAEVSGRPIPRGCVPTMGDGHDIGSCGWHGAANSRHTPLGARHHTVGQSSVGHNVGLGEVIDGLLKIVGLQDRAGGDQQPHAEPSDRARQWSHHPCPPLPAFPSANIRLTRVLSK
jgi:hypothetical protein